MSLKRIFISLVAFKFLLASPLAYSHSKTYLGFFGGATAMSGSDIHQFGTAFFLEAFGGPLAVNAFGSSNNNSAGVIGGHLGVSWCNNRNNTFSIAPAIELESYYIGRVQMTGDLINQTDRLVEKEFSVNYPLSTSVFLTNIVLNAHNLCGFKRYTPYLAVGIGSSRKSITGASSIQLNPPEGEINHYSGYPDAKTITLAAQTKVGLRFDISCASRIFAEYRFLYLYDTSYSFGSTVDPEHVPTSPWLVKIKPQYCNMGIVGIEFTF